MTSDRTGARPPRLVATDLDGTLFAPGAVISPRTAAAVTAAVGAGVEVVAATGRSHWNAVPLLAPLPVRWLICSNGATVYHTEVGEVVVRRALPDATVAEVIDRLTAAFPTVGVAWEDAAGVGYSDRFDRNREATNPDYVVPLGGRHGEELVLGPSPIVKLLVDHHELHTMAWLRAVQPHLPPGVVASTSGASFVEITVAAATKGQAVADLCRQLGVDRADTVAFGDHANDLDMLAWVGAGYAMANADAEVLAAVAHRAPHHAEDGVARVLEALLAGA